MLVVGSKDEGAVVLSIFQTARLSDQDRAVLLQALKGAREAVHARYSWWPEAVATVWMSLSPRPDRVTSVMPG